MSTQIFDVLMHYKETSGYNHAVRRMLRQNVFDVYKDMSTKELIDYMENKTQCIIECLAYIFEPYDKNPRPFLEDFLKHTPDILADLEHDYTKVLADIISYKIVKYYSPDGDNNNLLELGKNDKEE